MQPRPSNLETLISDQLLFNFSCWCVVFLKGFPNKFKYNKDLKRHGGSIWKSTYNTFPLPSAPSREASRVTVCHHRLWVTPSHFSLTAFSGKPSTPILDRYHSTLPRRLPDRVTDHPKAKIRNSQGSRVNDPD